jgi:hypothetical protein
MSLRLLKLLVAVAAVIATTIAGPVATSSATPPIWEPNFGAELPEISEKDDEAITVPLGTFSFPFYGAPHAGAETFAVSSNGLIEIGPKPPLADNSPSGSEARLGSPKIAALWADFNPSTTTVDGGAVYMNSFNEDADPAIDRVVFTWNSVFFGCETKPTCRALVQVQLFDTGRIVFGYNGVLTNQAIDDFDGGAPLMPVIAQGGFVTPPGFVPPPAGVDFSEMVPFSGGSLIFEDFQSRPIHFDLDQNDLIFTPGAGGYQVTSALPFAKPAEAGPAASATDKKAPKAKIKAGKQKLEKVLSKGLKLQLSCNEACFAEVSASLKSPKLKKAGSGSAELSKSGKGTVIVKLDQAARKALANASSATFKLSMIVFDEAGNKSKVKTTVKAK